MLLKQLALVSETAAVSFGQVAQISAALQKQVSRDFGPIWNIQATIDAFQTLDDVPAGYWPILIRDDIDQPGAAGYHKTDDGQPLSLVRASTQTSLTCSHECLEMLADPSGDRLIPGDSLKNGQGRVLYLLEVCDPSESVDFAYRVNGILVSDFYTPNFFDPVANPAIRYSFSGAIQRPLQVLDGGYLSWQVPGADEWWQFRNFGPAPGYVPLQAHPLPGQSLREFIDAHMHHVLPPPPPPSLLAMPAGAHWVVPPAHDASQGWATRVRKNVARIIQASQPTKP